MAQINFSLPEGLKAQIDRVVAEGNYASPSDYLRDLVRRDQDRQEQLADLRAALEKGRASGVDPRAPEDILEAIIAKHRTSA